MTNTILVIDDDPTVLRFLEHALHKQLGYEVRTGESAADLWKQLAAAPPDVVILDVMLPDGNGVDLLPEVIKHYLALPVIVLTGQATIELAVEAMKRGAYDFLAKPVDLLRLEISLRRAIEHRDQTEQIAAYRRGLGALDSCGEMAGRHPTMQLLYAQIENVAPSNVAVLITGESGTGKELVARALHTKSKRARSPFVDINCAAIPHELLESEMFGHEKGSFTGAHRQYVGCFERAHGGTLFLDEICEMDIHLQAKLLRVLQDGRFARIGGDQKIATDVRTISATNRDPEQALETGKLREDLYYRLDVVHLHVPPLRERRSDIPLLAHHYLDRLCPVHGKSFRDFDEDALEALIACPWKGNVRELINVLEQAIVLNQGEIITTAMLPPHVAQAARQARAEGESVKDSGVLPFWLTEKLEIEKALRLSGGNVGEAAKKLQISQATLYRKVQKYGLIRK
jgi:DNA-binding NtrC family response regulator